jgi:hypothetical protein
MPSIFMSPRRVALLNPAAPVRPANSFPLPNVQSKLRRTCGAEIPTRSGRSSPNFFPCHTSEKSPAKSNHCHRSQNPLPQVLCLPHIQDPPRGVPPGPKCIPSVSLKPELATCPEHLGARPRDTFLLSITGHGTRTTDHGSVAQVVRMGSRRQPTWSKGAAANGVGRITVSGLRSLGAPGYRARKVSGGSNPPPRSLRCPGCIRGSQTCRRP